MVNQDLRQKMTEEYMLTGAQQSSPTEVQMSQQVRLPLATCSRIQSREKLVLAPSDQPSVANCRSSFVTRCVWMVDDRLAASHDSSAGGADDIFRNAQEVNFRLPSEPVMWNSAQHDPAAVKLSSAWNVAPLASSLMRATMFKHWFCVCASPTYLT